MSRRICLTALCLVLVASFAPAETWARGFGGGRGGGGGMRGGGGGRPGGMSPGGLGGGGFSGGVPRGPQGMSPGGPRPGGFPGGMNQGNFNPGNFNPGNFNAGNFNPGNFNRPEGGVARGFEGMGGPGPNRPGGFDDPGAGGAFGPGGRSFDPNFAGGNARGFGAEGGVAGAAPNRNELGNFLGLPSDEGMGALSGARTSPGGNVDFNYGAAEGPRGGVAGGITATGPDGNTVGRAGGVGAEGGRFQARGFEGEGGASGFQARGVGPDGGVAGARGFEGPGGAGAVQGAAIGPNGRVAAGEAARGPNGGAAARGVVAGPNGVAGGFARVSPSGRYTSAAAVRGDFNNWGLYDRGWRVDHPGAWYAAGWAAGTAWTAATWSSVGAWMSYYPVEPVYYDYGTNVVYQDGSVYVDGQSAGTTQQYYDQASQLASTGAQAEATPEEDWLPLGVFSLTKPDESSTNLTIQLAVNKQGVIRGNYTDSTTDITQTVQGSVDKATQRAAFTIGDKTEDVVETGIYNLTKDEAPVLIHFGQDRTEQWLLVRLKQPAGAATNDEGASDN